MVGGDLGETRGRRRGGDRRAGYNSNPLPPAWGRVRERGASACGRHELQTTKRPSNSRSGVSFGGGSAGQSPPPHPTLSLQGRGIRNSNPVPPGERDKCLAPCASRPYSPPPPRARGLGTGGERGRRCGGDRRAGYDSNPLPPTRGRVRERGASACGRHELQTTKRPSNSRSGVSFGGGSAGQTPPPHPTLSLQGRGMNTLRRAGGGWEQEGRRRMSL